ncbi:MAG TPA: hypothetical protein PL033_18125 [Candidatus Brocadiia bacterium]|nr:hypothetical protein [Candidatus Brocadiia bacterium]
MKMEAMPTTGRLSRISDRRPCGGMALLVEIVIDSMKHPSLTRENKSV